MRRRRAPGDQVLRCTARRFTLPMVQRLRLLVTGHLYVYAAGVKPHATILAAARPDKDSRPWWDQDVLDAIWLALFHTGRAWARAWAWLVRDRQPLRPFMCVREVGHETPCNGFPRPECPQL